MIELVNPLNDEIYCQGPVSFAICYVVFSHLMQCLGKTSKNNTVVKDLLQPLQEPMDDRFYWRKAGCWLIITALLVQDVDRRVSPFPHCAPISSCWQTEILGQMAYICNSRPWLTVIKPTAQLKPCSTRQYENLIAHMSADGYMGGWGTNYAPGKPFAAMG
jgi:hypothetical protein